MGSGICPSLRLTRGRRVTIGYCLGVTIEIHNFTSFAGSADRSDQNVSFPYFWRRLEGRVAAIEEM